MRNFFIYKVSTLPSLLRSSSSNSPRMLLLWSLVLQVILFNFSNTDSKHVLIGTNASVHKIIRVLSENATIEELPYQVSVIEEDVHICGGSIIKPNVILTAAQCVVNKLRPKDILIRAGSSYNNKDGQVVNVSRICVHPKFLFYPLDYDVATLLLEKNLRLGPAVKPIELQPVNEVVPDGTIGLVSGWSNGYPGADQLQIVGVRKQAFNTCKINNGTLNTNITRRMTCYGHIGCGISDACQVDNGDPLVVNGKQVGIVSFSRECGVPLFITDISNKEIRNHILNCTGQ